MFLLSVMVQIEENWAAAQIETYNFSLQIGDPMEQ